MSLCYQVGRTDQGDELRCSLLRNHKEDHYDTARDQSWSVNPLTCAWATDAFEQVKWGLTYITYEYGTRV